MNVSLVHHQKEEEEEVNMTKLMLYIYIYIYTHTYFVENQDKTRGKAFIQKTYEES